MTSGPSNHVNQANGRNYNPLSAGTGGSVVVERCQSCGSSHLRSILSLGYLPPVNTMAPIGQSRTEQVFYPADLLRCEECELVQLGCIVDPGILFPPHYPYTSGTTRILRENFADLYAEVQRLHAMGSEHLAVDIGSNDGTLLQNFKKRGHRVFGVEPTNAGQLAIQAGIPTLTAFFGPQVAERIREEHGAARIVTAANVFAHIENIHDIVDGIVWLLDADGIFVSESHYLLSLVETLQYDTIYHEHLRYYSLASLSHLLAAHGLEVFHARQIPTHGGSIRVYAARRGQRPVMDSVATILREESSKLSPECFTDFRRRVIDSRLDLLLQIIAVRRRGERVYAVGAPSRASTLVNYVGLDEGLLDCVLEIAGSYKIGRCMPGTTIPVMEETRLVQDQPEYALLLSWHIAEELTSKLRALGFKGKFLIPLPVPRVLD